MMKRLGTLKQLKKASTIAKTHSRQLHRHADDVFMSWPKAFEEQFRRYDKMMEDFRRQFDHSGFFGSMPAIGDGALTTQGIRAPLMDVKETAGNYQFIVDLPGIPKEKIQLEYNQKNHSLRLNAEVKTEKQEDVEKEGKYHRVERRYRSYERVVKLPDDVSPESIKADLKDGVLTITIDKSKTENARKVQIPVQ